MDLKSLVRCVSVAPVVCLLALGGCGGFRASRIGDAVKEAAPACDVRTSANGIFVDRCGDWEVAATASRALAEQCEEIDAAGIGTVSVEMIGSEVRRWSRGDTRSCAVTFNP